MCYNTHVKNRKQKYKYPVRYDVIYIADPITGERLARIQKKMPKVKSPRDLTNFQPYYSTM